MENKSWVYGIGGAVVGAVVVSLFMGALSPRSTNMSGEMMKPEKTIEVAKKDEAVSGGGMSMADMNEALKGKTGDAFDKAFIELMVEHHQGAIDMANLIDGRAKHDEIKRLGKGIIAAQTTEIADMKKWAAAWGYTTEGAEPMMEMMH